MTAAWMIYVLLVGTLLATGAVAIDAMLRRNSLPTRWVWIAALGGIAALAVLAPARNVASSVELPTLVRSGPSTYGVASAPSMLTLLAERRNAIVALVTHALGAMSARVPSVLIGIFAVAWLLASATLLALLVIVNRRMLRARHAWPTYELHGSPVRVAPDTGPAVIGLAKPEIVVPRWLFDRSVDEQRLVIAHEREHASAHDQLLPIGGWLVAALIPWHPAVWWALSRLRLAIELDCDARVIARGVQPRSYGTLLIDIAGQYTGRHMGVLALADSTSHLERRLLAMKPTRSRYPRTRIVMLASVAALAIVMACEARLPTDAEVKNMDVATAEKLATAIRERRNEITKANPLDGQGDKGTTYTVNGRIVTADSARAITANQIATVKFAKDSAQGRSSINVTTLEALTPDGLVRMRYKRPMGSEQNDTMPVGKMKERRPFNGLLIVDGVQVPSERFATLSPNDIESVDVMKGEAAARYSADPAAVNGIIRVVTKHGAKK